MVIQYPIYSLTHQEVNLPCERSYQVGENYIFTGDKKLITSNGISSVNDYNGNTLYLTPGVVVTPCKNQYINYEEFNFNKDKSSGRKINRYHYMLTSRGCPSNCKCGCCGYQYQIGDNPECNCEKTDPIDPGKQKCIIS